MVEREARANRFVSLLVDGTVKPKPSQSNSRALPSLPDLKAAVEAQFLPDQLKAHPEWSKVGYLVPQRNRPLHRPLLGDHGS